MRLLRITICTLFLFAGMAVAVSAQKDDQKRPKPPPPVVRPGEGKPPRGNPPKGDERPPKKPEMSWFFVAVRSDGEAA
ncbi:MAG TPA: hypothetical protein VGQ55_00435 [Pyrinomonadaceae bacterium]|nr:hypothetical protein [Pyrinomonadaceae bacterium]